MHNGIFSIRIGSLPYSDLISLFGYVYACMCAFVSMHLCTSACMYVPMYFHIFVCLWVRVCVSACVHLCLCLLFCARRCMGLENMYCVCVYGQVLQVSFRFPQRKLYKSIIMMSFDLTLIYNGKHQGLLKSWKYLTSDKSSY